MKRNAALILLLLLGGPARGQNKPAGPAARPADSKPAAANAPAANAARPANAPAAPESAPAGKAVTVRVPSGGSYTVYIQEAPTSLKTIQDKGDLDVPAGLSSYTVYVLDSQSGYAARKTVDTKSAPAELTFASPDFKLVQKVRVAATGKGDKPIAQGIVTLTDGGKNTSRKVIQPSSQGAAEFDFVVSGADTITVTPEGGSATTKEVTLDLRKGETVQTIPVGMPEVTNVVEPAAGPGSSAPAANVPVGNAPAGNAPAANAPAANAPAPTAAAPAPAPAPVPAAQPLPPPRSNGDSIGPTIIGFVFLIGVLFAAYLYMRNRGITVDMLLKKMGVQPDAVAVGGGSLAGANLSTGAPGPGVAPAPPPIVSDPNQCPFCGQMKDAAGNCACTVGPGGGGGAAYGGSPAAQGSGPRLVGMAGTYMGQVFPIHGSVVVGREPSNPVPLDRDTTASRRHAQITADASGYRVQDLGSSNGTFVNGARVTEAPLQPGDEVSIGGTRFRFEV